MVAAGLSIHILVAAGGEHADILVVRRRKVEGVVL